MRVMPDGCIDVIWRSDRAALVAGPDTGPVLARLSPGSGFRRGALPSRGGRPGAGPPLHELCDLRVDLGELFQPSRDDSIPSLRPRPP